jgi:hypothetical protein
VTALPQPPTTAEQIIRRWKRIFLGIYLSFTVVVCLLTLLSILVVHCGGRPAPLTGPRITERAKPDEIRSCHRDLERLATDLHRETFSIQAKALRYETDPATEWRNWSGAWQNSWRSLGWRCRLQDDQGGNPALEKMASIHGALRDLQHSYSGVMDRFMESYAQRLRRVRRELTDVRTMIDRHAGPDTTGVKR